MVTTIAVQPQGFTHNADMAMSATGVALSRTYYDPNLGVKVNQPGYINNGDFNVYPNWPALGFKAIAAWYQLLGKDSIDNARLLVALLYACTTVLFFAFLLRSEFDFNVAVLSTILFVVLPQHLTYGNIIFADMWLLPFWLLSFLIFTAQPKFYFLIVFIAIFATLNFMWFVFFVIPALVVMLVYRHYALSARQMGLLLLLSVASIWLFQKLLLTVFDNVPLFAELRQWSVFPLLTNIKLSAYLVLKSSARVLYEAIPVLLLVGCVTYLGVVRNGLRLRARHLDSFIFVGLTLFFAVLSLPSWFVTHNTSSVFFSVLIAVTGALVLQSSNQQQPRKTVLLGCLSIVAAVALYAGLPHLTQGRSNIATFKQIVEHISQTDRHTLKRPNVIFSLRSDRGWSRHGLKMAVKEELRAYIFRIRSPKEPIKLVDYFQSSTSKLRRLDAPGFDSSKFYYVTDFPYTEKLLHSNYLSFTEYSLPSGVFLYEFELEVAR
ncbi:hypothetical protein DFR28_101348 [Arenicella xantha]|uniref:Dolichyl-phosphate-mannose-protein mannosyltransferase n=2 Tax=Arenicella xantha TaxID=644221 RepID=A0A395JMS4_9GAMM|nr:hypothetical protein DFR28_101348 [Arenicella xantha]